MNWLLYCVGECNTYDRKNQQIQEIRHKIKF